MPIPRSAQSAFGGKKQFWVSLQTKDEREAARRAVPVIDDLKQQIDHALSGVKIAATPPPVGAPAPAVIVSPDTAYSATRASWPPSTPPSWRAKRAPA